MVSRGSTCPVANAPSRSPYQQTIFRHTPSWSSDFGLQMEGIVIAWCICTTWISRNHPMTGTFCLFGFPLPIFRGFPGSIAPWCSSQATRGRTLATAGLSSCGGWEIWTFGAFTHRVAWIKHAWNHIGNIGVTQLGMGLAHWLVLASQGIVLVLLYCLLWFNVTPVILLLQQLEALTL